MRLSIITAAAAFTPAVVLGTAFPADTAATEAAAADARSASCCFALKEKLGASKVSFPNEAAYIASDQSYWAVQERDLTPRCITFPASTQDVSKVVKLLGDKECKFAIRSGGHWPWAGGSNIDKGVTVDLSAIDEVTLASDRKSAVLGTGAKWSKVYQTLDALNSSVVGGRNSDVGVGGLIVGGGNSFFTARYGFAADNVYNYEVVLADGSVVNANKNTRSDLFKALKGSSNNLGIVTRFTVRAIDYTEIWGGIVVYPDMSTTPAQLRNFVDFTNQIKDDPFGSLIEIHAFTDFNKDGVQIFNVYDYTKPVNNPPPFKEILKMGPEVVNTINITKLGPIIDQLQTEPNARNIFATVSFKNDLTVLKEVREIFARHFAATKPREIYDAYYMQIQPLPRVFTDHSLENGGNVLGLDRFPGNNILCLFELGWKNATNDAANARISEDVISDITRYLKSAGAYIPYEYLNYADRFQDPLAGYGPENVKFIKKVAAKYDPKKVFQKLVPGPFKISKV